MGGKIRFFVSGSAALSREVQEWFYAAGLLILEGYGLTETSAASFVNHRRAPRFGTVGPPLPGTEVKIAADGEILIKGAGVMSGYHNQPDATAEVLTDGWFATGDIGELDDHGYLRITDRKKDLIKTSGGKYVAPQKVEGVLKAVCPYISQIVIHGDGRKYISALITLDPEAITDWAKENSLDAGDLATLVEQPAVRQLIDGYVTEANGSLERWETIKRFVILPGELSVESGEVTPSLKIRRKAVERKYSDLLDGLYDPGLIPSMAEVTLGAGALAGTGVYAARDFAAGETVLSFRLRPLDESDYRALPAGEDLFVHSYGGRRFLYPEPARFVNHADDPSCAQDFEASRHVALRAIAAGEPITIDARLETARELDTFLEAFRDAATERSTRGLAALIDDEATLWRAGTAHRGRTAIVEALLGGRAAAADRARVAGRHRSLGSPLLGRRRRTPSDPAAQDHHRQLAVALSPPGLSSGRSADDRDDLDRGRGEVIIAGTAISSRACSGSSMRTQSRHQVAGSVSITVARSAGASRCQSVAVRRQAQAPRPATRTVRASPSAACPACRRRVSGMACRKVSITACRVAGSSGPVRSTASRSCCWWTQSSVKSRAQSSQTGAGSGPAQLTGSPSRVRSLLCQNSASRSELAASRSRSTAGLIPAVARTHSSLMRFRKTGSVSPSAGPAP